VKLKKFGVDLNDIKVVLKNCKNFSPNDLMSGKELNPISKESDRKIDNFQKMVVFRILNTLKLNSLRLMTFFCYYFVYQINNFRINRSIA
jgi:hypothetical protein